MVTGTNGPEPKNIHSYSSAGFRPLTPDCQFVPKDRVNVLHFKNMFICPKSQHIIVCQTLTGWLDGLAIFTSI